MPLDFGVLLPLQNHVAGHFSAVIADHYTMIAQYTCNPVQFTGNAGSRQRRSHHNSQTLPVDAFVRLLG